MHYSFIHFITYSVNFLSTYNGPGTLLSIEDMVGNKTEQIPVLMSHSGCRVEGGGEGKLDINK